MKISNEKKKEILLKNFEIIKDNYVDNRSTLSDAVVKMFKIDIDTAVDMWSYLLTKHSSHIKGRDSWCLTGSVVYEGGKVLGKAKMGEIILCNPVLKKAIFSQTCHDIYIVVDDIIRIKIETNDLQEADELLSMVYKNKYRDSSWYKIMDEIVREDMEITEEAYDLLDMWCDKVESKEERAKLSIKMLEFIDE